MLSEAEVEARNAKIRKFSEEERDSLQTQWQELDNEIEAFSQEQKRLKADASRKCKTFLKSSKYLKEEQVKKTKLDRPTTATMENILSNYEISPAQYHGVKFNGVDCRQFTPKANDICSEIQAMLLSVDHPQQCSDEINLNYLWSQAGLSFMSKIHGMLALAADQVQHLGGIGDMLEDDLEHLHQVSKRIIDCEDIQIMWQRQQATSFRTSFPTGKQLRYHPPAGSLGSRTRDQATVLYMAKD